MIQNGLQRETQNPSKIIENLPWDLPGSLSVHLWPTWLQNGPKMVPKDLQMEPKWSSEDPKSKWKSTSSNNKLRNEKVYILISAALTSILEIF